jgi:sugar phosphate isomerase/epimerase
LFAGHCSPGIVRRAFIRRAFIRRAFIRRALFFIGQYFICPESRKSPAPCPNTPQHYFGKGHSTMTLPPLGAQLLVFGGHPTLKYDIETQTDLILDSIAEAGYAAVEGGASDGAAYKRALDARGLRYGGSHVGLAALRNPAPLIEYLKAVDSRDICNSGVLTWDNPGADDYRAALPILNEAGKAFRREGIHLHYHHHDFEFKAVEGAKTGMDILLEGLDPEAVDLCVDIAWVKKGGSDPAAYLVEHQDRIGYLHFKDYDADGWTELGAGVVDIAAVMQVLPDLPGIRWVMVEQDTTKRDPRESIAISRRYLKETFGY